MIFARVRFRDEEGECDSRTALEAYQAGPEWDVRIRQQDSEILLEGEAGSIFQVLQGMFLGMPGCEHVEMEITLSHRSPPKGEWRAISQIHPIGYVENAHDEPASSTILRATDSRIVLDPDLTAGLEGLYVGQRILVLFHFHKAVDYEMRQHPRGDPSRPKKGVFTLRSPRRPNWIGATEVELIKIDRNILQVRGLDAINGTPVLDIKPA
jgi:tRNA-Thr(GGU) m(6)t(6)A37 methyltransferase TsaA